MACLSLSLTTLASLLGTAVGNGLRTFVIAQMQDDAEEIIVTGVLTNTLLATLLSLGAKNKRPLRAFVLGGIFSVVTGDRPDRLFFEQLEAITGL